MDERSQQMSGVVGAAAAAPWPAPLYERRLGPVVLRVLPPTHPSRDLEMVAALLGSAVAAGLVFLPLRSLAPLVGTCTFRDWTGLPCLTCGSTRAVVALGGGRWLLALRENPLLTTLTACLLAYTPAAFAMWLGRLPRVRIAPATSAARWGLLALVVLVVLGQWAFLIADGR